MLGSDYWNDDTMKLTTPTTAQIPELDSIAQELNDQIANDVGERKFSPRPDVKNILVTGGAGFIASFIVRKLVLLYPEYNVVNFDKLDYCASTRNLMTIEHKDNYSFIKGDITIKDMVNFVLQEKQIDTILHFAAQTHVDNSFGNSAEFTLNNVMGTHVLLEAARINNVKRFIHISTDEVYGEVEHGGDELSEDNILAPTNPYSATKAAAEMLVGAYQKSFNLPTIITRSNNVYGPYQYPEKIIPKFVTLLSEGRKVFIHGDGSNTRRFIYGSDVADAVEVILHKGEIGQTYNIGTSFEISNLELTKFLIKQMGLSARESELIEFVEDRPFNDMRYAIDSTKLEALGWKPKVEFEEGVKKTIAWYTKYSRKWWSDISGALVAHPYKSGTQQEYVIKSQK
ncbi:dTDP-glucose 4,6-dehydratase [Spizellomyces punctatus DAOM BR117]|uniref:dTDP-glucose 4,6-dehydratase n=1 Tax=Spizellomyces punctatus (strain DAOM BR117) TaxID=645134 RepID=A0A0L0HWA2_SPIPD|nr:dTDP-glucose 4,6-dehydratase [Spizellomyces punctatus DAOM BR117]KND05159.1 dTDP-glucose 4,6-dehydratase [Spizellomyces punctatus DAOM BR117]|eukprot:XP_016613198.1 dTDP-glucose 4,6-dehydratase [Spizellomyces punctatus DAOM BR117]